MATERRSGVFAGKQRSPREVGAHAGCVFTPSNRSFVPNSTRGTTLQALGPNRLNHHGCGIGAGFARKGRRGIIQPVSKRGKLGVAEQVHAERRDTLDGRAEVVLFLNIRRRLSSQERKECVGQFRVRLPRIG